jgi:hypothetical protein
MPLPLTKAKRDAVKAAVDAHIESMRASMESGKLGNKYMRPSKSLKDFGDVTGAVVDIHEYVSPEGSGWDAVLECVIDGVRYAARVKGSGPEVRDTDWTQQPDVR